MPSPNPKRMTRKNQGQWLFAIFLSLIATFLGLKNLTWFYQHNFGKDKIPDVSQIELLEDNNDLLVVCK